MADTTLQNTLQTGSQEKKKTYDPKRRKAMLDMLNAGEDPGFVRYNHVMHGFDQEEADDAINTFYQVTGRPNPLGDTAPASKTGEDLGTGEIRKRYESALIAKEGIEKYRDLYKEVTKDNTLLPTEISGEDAARLSTAHKLLLFDIATAQGTGALQAPDRELVEEALPDVTTANPLKIAQMQLRGGKEGNIAAFDAAIKRMDEISNSLIGEDGAAVTSNQPVQKSQEDQAFEWAQANPDDPRSQRVLEKLNTMGYKSSPAPEQAKEESKLVDQDTGEIKSKGFFDTIGEEVPKFFGSVADRFGSALDTAKSEAAQGKVPNLFGRTGLRAAGVVGGAINDAFSAVFNIGVSALPDEVRDTASKTMESVLSTDTGKAGLFALQQGQEAFEDFKSRNPEIAKDIEDVANIAMAIPASKVLGATGREAKAVVGDTAKVTSTIIGKEPVTKANDMIFRAVKPSITGGKKINQVKQSMETATRELVNRGYAPKNFQEYAESLTKAKADVWKEVESQIGASSARVNLRSIADEVKAMADDATIGRVDPNAAKRIKKIADSLVSQGDNVSVAEAESLKQYINGELKGTFGKFNLSASETNAKKLITAKLGQQLDDVLSSIPGEFSGLKKAYGALSQAEEDAMKRLVVFGRQNPAGLVESFSKISGIGNIIKGIVTASPADVAKGAGEIVLGKVQKSANNADDMIRKAFEGIKGSEEGFKSKLFNIRPGMNIQDVSKDTTKQIQYNNKGKWQTLDQIAQDYMKRTAATKEQALEFARDKVRSLKGRILNK